MLRSRLIMILLLALGIAALPSAALAEDRKGSISGTAYFDANANGHPDPQERAVRNIEISLDGPDYHETRKTLDNGSYEFSGLAAGKYTIGIKLPNGYGLSDAPTGDQTPAADLQTPLFAADDVPDARAEDAEPGGQPSDGEPAA